MPSLQFASTDQISLLSPLNSNDRSMSWIPKTQCKSSNFILAIFLVMYILYVKGTVAERVLDHSIQNIQKLGFYFFLDFYRKVAVRDQSLIPVAYYEIALRVLLAYSPNTFTVLVIHFFSAPCISFLAKTKEKLFFFISELIEWSESYLCCPFMKLFEIRKYSNKV